MNWKKKFLSSRNLIPASFLVGLMMAVAGSVLATSIGSNVSVSGTLTVTGATTYNGNSTLGDASADVNLFTGTLQASTTALFTSGLTAYSTVAIGTSSPAELLSVQGNALISGTTTVGSLIATSTLYVGITGSKFRVEESGNVGIGTSSPSTLLGVSGALGVGITNTGTGNSLYVNDAANDTSPFVIDAAGNVGIGTSTPGQELSVIGDVLASSAATTSLIIKSTASLVGGCIQLQATDGTWIRIYATTTPTGLAGGAQNLVVQAGACQ